MKREEVVLGGWGGGSTSRKKTFKTRKTEIIFSLFCLIRWMMIKKSTNYLAASFNHRS